MPGQKVRAMKQLTFIAKNRDEALAFIHAELGPDAVVLNWRKVPTPGLSRLWRRRGRIEVLAGVVETTEAKDATRCPPQISPLPIQTPPTSLKRQPATKGPERWRSVAWLETQGLLPVHAIRLQQQLNSVQGPQPPASLEDEWSRVCAALASFWRPPPPLENDLSSSPQVFIGPPGSGKSTALAKWLTLATLTEARRTKVWRLDGATANTAEFLTLHCEALGVPSERFWTTPAAGADLYFVDLPGVDATDPRALEALRTQLANLLSPRVHLVLNAAYETAALLAQWRAFAPLAPAELLFTHLDEEPQRVKLWNFVFGTNCTLRFLTGGQKLPGDFRPASPLELFPAATRQKP